MPREVTYRCKVCDVQKMQSNNWYVIKNTKVGFHLYTWEWAVREDQLDDEDTEFLCGESCGHKVLSQFFTSPHESTANAQISVDI